eukprot:contig_12380_g2955
MALPPRVVAHGFGKPRLVAAITVCCLYVLNTYLRRVPPLVYVFQATYGTALLAKLIYSFSQTEQPVHFLLTPTLLCDLASIPSLLFASGELWLNFSFLQAVAALRQYHALQRHRLVAVPGRTIHRVLLDTGLQLLVFIFTATCGLQFFELLGDPGAEMRSEQFELTTAHVIYFAVVTLLSVGYGDFVPYTLAGRLWVVVNVLFAAFLVAREISELLDAVATVRSGSGAFVAAPDIRHVVLTGHVRWEDLTHFVAQFVARPRHSSEERVVVMTARPAWSDADWNQAIAADGRLADRVTLLHGSPLLGADVLRAGIPTAAAVFVLPDQAAADAYHADSDVLKTVLAVRFHAPAVPIYTTNAVADSTFQFRIALQPVYVADEFAPLPLRSGEASRSSDAIDSAVGGEHDDVEEEVDGAGQEPGELHYGMSGTQSPARSAAVRQAALTAIDRIDRFVFRAVPTPIPRPVPPSPFVGGGPVGGVGGPLGPFTPRMGSGFTPRMGL